MPPNLGKRFVVDLSVGRVTLRRLVGHSRRGLRLILHSSLLRPARAIIRVITRLRQICDTGGGTCNLFDRRDRLTRALHLRHRNRRSFLTFDHTTANHLHSRLTGCPFTSNKFILFYRCHCLTIRCLLITILDGLDDVHIGRGLSVGPARCLSVGRTSVITHVSLAR